MLKSEVEDLKILLQSADKQLENLKRERNNDIIDNGRKCASLESKVRYSYFQNGCQLQCALLLTCSHIVAYD